jgi:O-antigen ligase
VIIVYSRIFELFGIGKVAFLVFLPTCMLALFAGQLRRAIFSPVGLSLIAFLGWLYCVIPFAFWRGGSLGVVVSDATRSVGLYFLVTALILRFRQYLALVTVVAFCGLLIAYLALFTGVYREGRLEFGYGTFSDPNALALFLLLSVPCWWLLARVAKSPFTKAALLLCTVPIFVAFARTGSRGGVAALLVMLIYHFAKSSYATKLRLVLVCLLAVAVVSPFMTPYLRERFLTYFTVSPDSEYSGRLEGSDVASTMSRWALFQQSVRLTATHPFFGVGPGNFADVIYTSHKQGDELFINHATHNSYTQISCESGVLGLLLLLAVLFCIWRRKLVIPAGLPPPLEEQAQRFQAVVHYSRLVLVFVAAVGLTLSFAYKPYFYFAMAMMVTAVQVCQDEMALLNSKAKTAETRPSGL